MRVWVWVYIDEATPRSIAPAGNEGGVMLVVGILFEKGVVKTVSSIDDGRDQFALSKVPTQCYATFLVCKWAKKGNAIKAGEGETGVWVRLCRRETRQSNKSESGKDACLVGNIGGQRREIQPVFVYLSCAGDTDWSELVSWTG